MPGEFVQAEERYSIFYYFCTTFEWGISSVGLERMLDRHEVTGSNPVYPTKKPADAGFFLWDILDSNQ